MRCLPLLLLAGLAAACSDAEESGAPQGPDAAEPPSSEPSRLVAVGNQVRLTYGDDGYPLTQERLDARWTFGWNAGVVDRVEMSDPSFSTIAFFTVEDGRITRAEVPAATARPGHPAPYVWTNDLEYDDAGNLSRSTKETNDGIEVRDFSYGDQNEILFVDSTSGDGTQTRDSFVYENGCPTRVPGSAGPSTGSITYAYGETRLVAYTFTDWASKGLDLWSRVEYDELGRMKEVGGVNQYAGYELEYEQGPAHGLHVVPGGAGGGLIGHPQFFDLHGRCDPTLRTPEKILGLLVLP